MLTIIFVFLSNVLDLQELKEMWDFSIAQQTCFDVQWLSRIDRSLIFTTPHVWIIKYALEIILEQNRHYHEASVAIISTYMLHVRWYDVIKCLSSGLRDIILHVYIEIFIPMSQMSHMNINYRISMFWHSKTDDCLNIEQTTLRLILISQVKYILRPPPKYSH